MRAWALLLLLLVTALAGCSSDDGDGEPAPDDPTDGTGDETGNDDAGSGDDDHMDHGGAGDGAGDGMDHGDGDGMDHNGTVTTNTPPLVDLLADSLMAQVPFNVNFTFEGSDADGDELKWTFDADGDGIADSDGTSLPFNFTYSYTEAGNFTAMLEVTDGKATVNDTLIIEAVAGPSGPAPTATIEDGTLDGAAAIWDIEGADIEVTADSIIAVIHVTVAGPGVGDWPAQYRLHVGSVAVEAYVLLSGGLWNVEEGEAADGTSEWDAAAGTITITLARSYVEQRGFSAPYDVYVTSWLGEGQLAGVVEIDRAPDEGTVQVGSP